MRDAIMSLKRAIEDNELKKSEIASEIGWDRQRLHALLEHGKRIDYSDYCAIRHAIEERGVRIDGTETMSVTALSAYINTEAAKLTEECVRALEDGVLSLSERESLRMTIDSMVTRLNTLRRKL